MKSQEKERCADLYIFLFLFTILWYDKDTYCFEPLRKEAIMYKCCAGVSCRCGKGMFSYEKKE